MKRATILMGVLAFLTAVALYAADDHGRSGGNGGGSGHRSSPMGMSHSNLSRPMSSRQPMTIHMNHTSSSGSAAVNGGPAASTVPAPSEQGTIGKTCRGL